MKGKQQMAGQEASEIYQFSYDENTWMDEAIASEDAIQAGLMQAAQSGEWRRFVPSGRQSSSVASYGEVESLDELQASVREAFFELGDFPDVVFTQPFDKLTVLMQRQGLSFVGGLFTPFEGNHSDSEIYAVLRQA